MISTRRDRRIPCRRFTELQFFGLPFFVRGETSDGRALRTALSSLPSRFTKRRPVQHIDPVQSRDTLLKAVWNYDAGLSTRPLDVHIAWLRQKLEEDPARPRHMVTVRGLGYKFVG
ncbi:MAG TPA: helix-turn-helix domain-containing protein [Bryobacteraceae bacterium]|nr:helix-turn-helix domain-containing protein [Bryobacteraceae bacterium]